MNAAQLQSYLHDRIPITLAMGVEVTRLDEEFVRVRAPLEPNINHRKTVFGGSLNTLATVCAWSCMFVCLEARRIRSEIVIRKSEMTFLRPATSAFEAACALPAAPELEQFSRGLLRGRMARLNIHSTVSCERVECATFVGEFVAIPARAVES